MTEVDNMLMEKLRQKAIQWKHDYDHADCCNETNIDDELESKVQMKANLISHKEGFKKVNDSYAKLMESCNNKFEIEKDCSPSLF